MNTLTWAAARFVALCVAVLTPLAASAAPVAIVPTVGGLASTGMASPGVPYAGGAIDPHWTYGYRSTLGPMPAMNNSTSVIPTPLPHGWVGNSAHSQWIRPTNSNPNPGYYYFQASFDLTGRNLSDIELAFRMTGDDEIACVVLNDWITPYTANNLPGSPAHGRWSDLITIDNEDRPGLTPSFLPGVNTLTFVVRNDDHDDTGLQVQIVSPLAVANPEPMTIALFGALSVVGVVGARRRGSRNS